MSLYAMPAKPDHPPVICRRGMQQRTTQGKEVQATTRCNPEANVLLQDRTSYQPLEQQGNRPAILAEQQSLNRSAGVDRFSVCIRACLLWSVEQDVHSLVMSAVTVVAVANTYGTCRNS